MKSIENRPNILFVFSDQHRWCDMNCYGNHEVLTPNFDKFAKDAIRFNNCISNSPVCVPARGSLLTGRLPLGHGAITNDLPIREGIPGIAKVLKENGYHTGYVGKWHLAGVPRDQYIPSGTGRLGFDSWKVCNCSHDYMDAYYYDENNNRIQVDGYEPIEQTHLASEFIMANQNLDQPWCLYLSWGPPHDPYQTVPDSALNHYMNRTLELRENVPEIIRHTQNENFTDGQIEGFLKGYYAHITALDEQFGRLIETLERTGQMDNTIIVYTSDHGDMLGSQGVTNKQWPYDESVKVPLMLSWQGKIRSGTSDELIGLVDLPVSILGLLGLKFPDRVEGQDLHRLFVDADAHGLVSCYIFDYVPCHQAASRGTREWRGIRTSRYTYARTACDEGFVLYDNIKDPLQLKNLIHNPQKRELKHQLMQQLNEHIEKYDRLLPWEDFIREYGLLEAWNKSQAYFNLPQL